MSKWRTPMSTWTTDSPHVMAPTKSMVQVGTRDCSICKGQGWVVAPMGAGTRQCRKCKGTGQVPDYQSFCKCVKKHIPNPVEYVTHYILPLEWGGEDKSENKVTLCPTTAANVTACLNMLREKGNKAVFDKHMSNYATKVAREGYKAWRELEKRRKREKEIEELKRLGKWKEPTLEDWFGPLSEEDKEMVKKWEEQKARGEGEEW